MGRKPDAKDPMGKTFTLGEWIYFLNHEEIKDSFKAQGAEEPAGNQYRNHRQ